VSRLAGEIDQEKSNAEDLVYSEKKEETGD
jgi:hypothetical protein